MRIVKLNSRHTLYKEHRFEYALRFESWTTDAQKYEFAASKAFGSQWNMCPRWKTHWTKPNGRTRSRPYWIGVQNEAMLTQILLTA